MSPLPIEIKYSLARLFIVVLRARGLLALFPAPHVVSSLKFTHGPGACRLSFERALDGIISRSSSENYSASINPIFFWPALWLILVQLVSSSAVLKNGPESGWDACTSDTSRCPERMRNNSAGQQRSETESAASTARNISENVEIAFIS